MDRLLELLKERSVAHGRFVLSSGRESHLFIDVKKTSLLAEGHALLGARLLTAVRALSRPAVAVAGVALGGCPLASSVSLLSAAGTRHLDAIYVRKAAKGHGTAQRIEGASHLRAGAICAVVEDVVTTGASTMAAVEALREADLGVAGIVAVVDRGEGGADLFGAAGIPFSALFDQESLR